MKRRLVLVLSTVMLALALMQVGPARASSPPAPKVVVNTSYVVCAGNYWIGRGVCVPWTL